MTDNHTPFQRSATMAAIKSRNTKPEILLGKALWARGVRYRKHCPHIAGRPDFAIAKYKLAIFVDGEFWHGKNWNDRCADIHSNRAYWLPKIERNIARDIRTNAVLCAAGWTVLRFWSRDVLKQTDAIADSIAAILAVLKAGKRPPNL